MLNSTTAARSTRKRENVRLTQSQKWDILMEKEELKKIAGKSKKQPKPTTTVETAPKCPICKYFLHSTFF